MLGKRQREENYCSPASGLGRIDEAGASKKPIKPIKPIKPLSDITLHTNSFDNRLASSEAED